MGNEQEVPIQFRILCSRGRKAEATYVEIRVAMINPTNYNVGASSLTIR